MRTAQIVRVENRVGGLWLLLNDGFWYLVKSPKMIAVLNDEKNQDRFVGKTLIIGGSDFLEFAPANLDKIQDVAPDMIQLLKNLILPYDGISDEEVVKKFHSGEDVVKARHLIAKIEA